MSDRFSFTLKFTFTTRIPIKDYISDCMSDCKQKHHSRFSPFQPIKHHQIQTLTPDSFTLEQSLAITSNQTTRTIHSMRSKDRYSPQSISFWPKKGILRQNPQPYNSLTLHSRPIATDKSVLLSWSQQFLRLTLPHIKNLLPHNAKLPPHTVKSLAAYSRKP